MCFHALLRTGEMLQVANKNVICSHDLVLIHVGQTQMAARNAGTKLTSFRDAKIALMLQAWKRVHPPHALLINIAVSSFRQWFARRLQATGLTQVFFDTQSYSAACQRGRWASEPHECTYRAPLLCLRTEAPTSQLSIASGACCGRLPRQSWIPAKLEGKGLVEVRVLFCRKCS